MMSKEIFGNVVNIGERKIFPGKVEYKDGKIVKITHVKGKEYKTFILPGFVDSHVHVESSMLTPMEFGRAVMALGCVGSVSDPHEIANVCGVRGVEYMIESAKKTACKISFCAPSCVPASPFAKSGGGNIGAEVLEKLFEKYPEIVGLGEMMNFPGVVSRDESVMAKLKVAQKAGKVIDGHAPGLRGNDLDLYISAGCNTDHEAFQFEEAKEKVEKKLVIQIRQGSAAKDFDVLWPLMKTKEFIPRLHLCSDDCHPDRLVEKLHIRELVSTSVAKGIDVFDVLQIACINPVKLYKLEIGLLQEKDPADFIVVDNLKDFNVLQTVIDGDTVFDCKKSTSIVDKTIVSKEMINNFQRGKMKVEDVKFSLPEKNRKIKIINAVDGSLFTTPGEVFMPMDTSGNVVSDCERDILKMVVVNRYDTTTKPSIGFVKNFGVKNGALASSVLHDSHNLVCVGSSDESIVAGLNMVIENKGGMCSIGKDGKGVFLPLPIGGLMSNYNYEYVASKYSELENFAIKELKSTLKSPFGTLSFMGLSVIPSIKLSDSGLVDGDRFKLIKWRENPSFASVEQVLKYTKELELKDEKKKKDEVS